MKRHHCEWGRKRLVHRGDGEDVVRGLPGESVPGKETKEKGLKGGRGSQKHQRPQTGWGSFNCSRVLLWNKGKQATVGHFRLRMLVSYCKEAYNSGSISDGPNVSFLW